MSENVGNGSSHQIIEREVPELSYEIIEGMFKHLQGQILTVVEATSLSSAQTMAVKSLIRNFFNDKLTLAFDYWGRNSGIEIPNYSDNISSDAKVDSVPYLASTNPHEFNLETDLTNK